MQVMDTFTDLIQYTLPCFLMSKAQHGDVRAAGGHHSGCVADHRFEAAVALDAELSSQNPAAESVVYEQKWRGIAQIPGLGQARSPLIFAVWAKDLELAEFLVRHGAHPNSIRADSDFSGSALSELILIVDDRVECDHLAPMLRLFMTLGGGNLDADSGSEQGYSTIREEFVLIANYHLSSRHVQTVLRVLEELGIKL